MIDNFDAEYRLFERAKLLRDTGAGSLVFVPIAAEEDGGRPNAVAEGIAEVMIRLSRLGPVIFVPIRHSEPISLNAARALRDALVSRGVGAVTVVTPLFRSRRALLVYDAVFTPSGINVICEPVGDARAPATWTGTWHGIQDVTLQWLKLQYYRFSVLPFVRSQR